MTAPTQAQIEAAAKVLAADTGLSELVRVPLRKLAESALTAAAQVGEQGKVVNPATVEELDAIIPTQAQIEAVALALYNNAGAPTETLAKAAISAAARVWEPFTSEGYRALPQYDPETVERCAHVAWQILMDAGCPQLAIKTDAAIRKLEDEP